MLTKLDVLDTFETIKIGVSYKLHGNVIEGFPSDINLLSKVDVEYIEMAGILFLLPFLLSYNTVKRLAGKY
jgi:adenylosuccinate synthase